MCKVFFIDTDLDIIGDVLSTEASDLWIEKKIEKLSCYLITKKYFQHRACNIGPNPPESEILS